MYVAIPAEHDAGYAREVQRACHERSDHVCVPHPHIRRLRFSPISPRLDLAGVITHSFC